MFGNDEKDQNKTYYRTDLLEICAGGMVRVTQLRSDRSSIPIRSVVPEKFDGI